MARPTTSTLTPSTATLAISAVGIAYAFGTFFARRLTDAGLSSTTVAFARFALVALVLAPRLRLDPDGRRATLWGLGSGAVMALGWIAYVDAIGNGDVALVGVACMTYPLFTLGALALFFRQKPTGRQMVGGLLVLVAAGVALSADAAGGGLPPVTFLAPATFGFSLAVLTERLGSLAPSERLASVAVGAVAVLLPVIGVLPADEVVPASAAQWGWILGLGVGAALVPMLLFAAAAPVIGAARSSVAGATELPTVLIIGALVFGEVLTARHLVAAVLVGGAIVVTSVGRAVHVIVDDDDPEMPLERPDFAPIPGEIAGEEWRKRTYVR